MRIPDSLRGRVPAYGHQLVGALGFAELTEILIRESRIRSGAAGVFQIQKAETLFPTTRVVGSQFGGG